MKKKAIPAIHVPIQNSDGSMQWVWYMFFQWIAENAGAADLSDYFTKEETEELLSVKLDKTTDSNILYGTDSDGEQHLYNVSDFPLDEDVVHKTGNETIKDVKTFTGTINSRVTNLTAQNPDAPLEGGELNFEAGSGEPNVGKRMYIDRYNGNLRMIGVSSSGTIQDMLYANAQTGYTSLKTPTDANLESRVAPTTEWVHNHERLYVTNCITKIPQDIKLELNGGTLTLKAGSKVYVPNGAGVFDVRNITSDISTTDGPGTQKILYAVSSGGNIFNRALSNCTSGAGATTVGGFAYDTTTNNIGFYNVSGVKQYSDLSFPICICTSTNGVITSIDQVFNGFGYIGSTMYVLPGVQVLIPNGRNADGTLKNTSLTKQSVNVFTPSSATFSQVTNIALGGTLSYHTFTYDEVNNKTSAPGYMNAGDVTWANGKITSFVPKTAFCAVDYNDYQKTVSQVDTNTANIALKQDEATAINYDNITNCIVKIPKDISVSFSGAVVTIAKGSTLYYPNGAGVFSSVVLTADETCTLSGTGDFYVFRRNASGTSGYYPEVISNINSGTATSSTSGVFYDTVNNRIDFYASGTRADRLFSFPVCRVKVNSGSIVSIERVFNGFGYVGKKVYALPGVQGLAPNGRNSDGSLKNSIVNITNVVTNDAYNSKFTIKNNQILPCYYTNYAEQIEKPSFANGDWFNPAENIYYRITNSVASPELYCRALDVIASGSGIQKATDINSKTVFRAVDYNDYKPVADQVSTNTANIALKQNAATAVTYGNISNCVTEVAQDLLVNLTSEGQFQLLSGSKVYVPNGSGTYTPKTFTSMAIRVAAIGSDRYLEFPLFNKSDLSFARLYEIRLARVCCGASDDLAGVAQHVWYDTSNNLLKYYGSDGTTNSYYCGFPVALVSGNGSKIANVYQVFNGFGFFGSSVFVLPGVKGLAPDGRNANGSLKSVSVSKTTVSVVNNLTSYNGYTVGLTSNNNLHTFYFDEYDQEEYPGTNYRCWYKPSENKLYNTQNAQGSETQAKSVSLFYFHAPSYTFIPKTPMQTVGYSDFMKKQDVSTAVNYDNITNCITEIPQDIKLTLSNGTLTLAAGSKFYYPNGSGSFGTYTLANNMVLTLTNYGTQSNIMLFVNAAKTGLSVEGRAKCYSGSTAPTGFTGYAMWYDTANNQIKRTTDGGSTWTPGVSFPLATITSTSNVVTSIDQVFNGFGYIGSTVFALPGVKGLISNGRNEDGGLKNSMFIVSSVLTYTRTTSLTGIAQIIVKQNNIQLGDYVTKYKYNEQENKFYYIPFMDSSWCDAGTYLINGTTITSFTPKTAFHAVDYGDFTTSKGFVVAAGESSGTGYTTWYRKYADGWVEQGGVVVKSMAATNTTYSWSQTLPVKMQGTMYTVNITSKSGWTLNNVCGLEGTTTTSISGYLKTTGGTVPRDIYVYWRVSGKYAE